MVSVTIDIGSINLSPNAPVLDAKHLNWLIERYIHACYVRLEHTPTVDRYAAELRWFTRWWDVEGAKCSWRLTPDDFVRFERYLRHVVYDRSNKPLAYHTRHTIIKRLKEALRWALEHGYVERDYTKWIPPAVGAPPKRKAATIAVLHRLIEAAGKTKKGKRLRDRAVVAMLMGMGLRRGELSNLNVEDVIVEADYSGYANVVGKRTKANPDGRRAAAFDSATGAIIVEYLDAFPYATGPLFLGERGERLQGRGVYLIVKRAIKVANLEGELTGPHDLRRAFATHYKRNRRESSDLLRRQLGHAHYSQTDEYTLMEVDDIRADLVSPLSLFPD